MADISQELKHRLVQPGTEARLMKLHRQVRGRTLVIVDPHPHMVYIRVFPTASLGEVMSFDRTTVWAIVSYRASTNSYLCRSRNLPGVESSFIEGEVITEHQSLNSAVRQARKYVARYAPRAPEGWYKAMLQKTYALDSVYPSVEAVAFDQAYARAYYRSVEADSIAAEEELWATELEGFQQGLEEM